MGLNMAKTLLRKACSVVGYDIRPSQVSQLVEAGGRQASTAQQVAEECTAVIVSLPNSPITEEVVLGQHGILSGVSAGSLVIDMGSSVPASTRMLGARLEEKGARMVDAPVSGGPQGAAAGSLAIIIGGAAEDIERAMPVFRLLGAEEKITIVGALGSGHMLKAINNFVYACCIWVCGEAFVVAAKAGLDANIVQKVISTSTARNNVVEDNVPNEILNRSFPVWFALGLLNKDINTFYGIAQDLGVTIPVGAVLKEMYNLGVREIGADVGDSKIVTLLEKWARVEVRG
jgi:3-hydroxyisobutyrate dehydrogenase-like beta-hydroxyacid dehydrogenase